MELDLPGSSLAERGEEQKKLIQAEVAASVVGKYLANPLPEKVMDIEKVAMMIESFYIR